MDGYYSPHAEQGGGARQRESLVTDTELMTLRETFKASQQMAEALKYSVAMHELDTVVLERKIGACRVLGMREMELYYRRLLRHAHCRLATLAPALDGAEEETEFQEKLFDIKKGRYHLEQLFTGVLGRRRAWRTRQDRRRLPVRARELVLRPALSQVTDTTPAAGSMSGYNRQRPQQQQQHPQEQVHQNHHHQQQPHRETEQPPLYHHQGVSENVDSKPRPESMSLSDSSTGTDVHNTQDAHEVTSDSSGENIAEVNYLVRHLPRACELYDSLHRQEASVSARLVLSPYMCVEDGHDISPLDAASWERT